MHGTNYFFTFVSLTIFITIFTHQFKVFIVSFPAIITFIVTVSSMRSIVDRGNCIYHGSRNYMNVITKCLFTLRLQFTAGSNVNKDTCMHLKV